MQTNESAAPARARIIRKTEIVVIGAGQAGLSSAYWLKRLGLEAGTGFAVLDANPQAGGAWQHRWPTLTLSTVNAVHDLPGLAFADVVDQGQREVKAAEAVPRYFARYEALYALPVLRPQRVRVVCPRGERFRVETDGPAFSARGIINATGTWENPNIPEIPGADRFGGRIMHSHDYRGPEEFAGLRVAIIGAGISAVQHLTEISRLAQTFWITRRPPVFREDKFTADAGREAVAMVEKRVREGLVPGSVVSVTGLPWTPALREAEGRGCWTGCRCSTKSPRPASNGRMAASRRSTSFCGRRGFAARSTILRRSICASRTAASSWAGGSRPKWQKSRACIWWVTGPRPRPSGPIAQGGRRRPSCWRLWGSRPA
ncbi:flavin-containing monooxygenase [Paracoccus cavernae]|uniref:flavin-containing monooxygenase n=1 Tax=Paracoccus cavernae TaxID=1571207 RepID=UPI003627951F